MLRRASVKLLLLSGVILAFLFGCGPTGSGDAYHSEVYDSYNTQHRGGIEVSSDRKSVRIYGNVANCGGGFVWYTGGWVNFRDGGTSSFSHSCWWQGVRYDYYYAVEISGNQLRAIYKTSNTQGNTNNYVGDWIPICSTSGGRSQVTSYIIETSYTNGRYYIRFCYLEGNQITTICGNWVEYVCPPRCPQGYTYNPSRSICEANPVYNCSSGALYNSSTGKCESPPTGQDYTCPIDPSLACIDDGSGNFYCSQNACYDAASIPPSNQDTQEGANDIPADGTVDASGCLGTVYIFNGRDMRCRPPGTQTGPSSCCKKTKTWFGLGQCNETERQLAALRDWGQLDGNCHYVGEYCAEYWGPSCCKICVQKKKTYCCFSSPLARIIHEQGRPQLGIGWGVPESPNCRGFTAQEFQKLDFSKIDFSEWIEEEVQTNIVPSIESNINNVINNMQNQYQGGMP